MPKKQGYTNKQLKQSFSINQYLIEVIGSTYGASKVQHKQNDQKRYDETGAHRILLYIESQNRKLLVLNGLHSFIDKQVIDFLHFLVFLDYLFNLPFFLIQLLH